MSIGVAQTIQTQRFQGHDDPRLPIGRWWGATQVTGDASGGIAFLQLNFSDAFVQVLNSNLYNLEGFIYSSQLEANAVGHITGANWRFPPGFVTVDHAYALPILDVGQPTLNVVSAEAYSFLPVFLGSQAQAGTAQTLVFVVTNTDLFINRFKAEGYIWGPRSVLADGGPQRPPGSIYGH